MSTNSQITPLLLTLATLTFLTLQMCTFTCGMSIVTTAKPALNETTNGIHGGNSSVTEEILSHKNQSNIVPLKNSTASSGQQADSMRTSRYYSPFSSGQEDLFNPFPSYFPPALGGSNGVGVLASSCAYAYPNRRYSCYGLGRR